MSVPTRGGLPATRISRALCAARATSLARKQARRGNWCTTCKDSVAPQSKSPCRRFRARATHSAPDAVEVGHRTVAQQEVACMVLEKDEVGAHAEHGAQQRAGLPLRDPGRGSDCCGSCGFAQVLVLGYSAPDAADRLTRSWHFGSKLDDGAGRLSPGRADTHGRATVGRAPQPTRWSARAAAAVRVSTPSFSNTCSRCLCTVRGLSDRISAMSRLVLPWMTQ